MEAVASSVGRKAPLYIGKYVMTMQKAEEVFSKVLIEEALSLPQTYKQPASTHLENAFRIFIVNSIDNSDLCVNQVIFSPCDGVVTVGSSSIITYNSYAITSVGYSDIGKPSSLTVESISLCEGGDQHSSPFPKGEMATIQLTSCQSIFVLDADSTELIQSKNHQFNPESITSNLGHLRNRHASILSMLTAVDGSRLPLSNSQFSSLFDFFRQYQVITSSFLLLLQPREHSKTAASYDTKDIDMEIVSVSNPTSPARKPHPSSDNNTSTTQMQTCMSLWGSVSAECVLTVIELLPSQPVMTTRDFAVVNHLLVGCENGIEQILSLQQVNSIIDMLSRFRELRREWCREIITDSTRLSAFVTNTARQEWKSNSPYMRNKRFSPGVIHYLSTIRETWWYIKHFTEVEVKLMLRDYDNFHPNIIANSVNVIFQMLGVSLREVVKVYSWIVCSRTRITQWQLDIQYVIYTAINTLISLDEFITSLTAGKDQRVVVYELLHEDVRLVYLCVWLLEIFLYLSKYDDSLQVHTFLQILDSSDKESIAVDWILLQSRLQTAFVWTQQLEVFDSMSLQQRLSTSDHSQYPFAVDTMALSSLTVSTSFSVYSQAEKDLFQKELGANAENHLVAAREVLFLRITARSVIDFGNSSGDFAKILRAVASFGKELLSSGNGQLASYYDLFKLHRVEIIDSDYPPLTGEQISFRKVFTAK